MIYTPPKRKVALTFGKTNPDPYIRALTDTGLEPVLISATNARGLDQLEGLVLSGGNDVDPQFYGERPSPKLEEVDRPRDEIEIALLKEALKTDRPVLAICRGMQLFNVVHGGSLFQHLETTDTHRVNFGDRALEAHAVHIRPGTKLAAIAGAGSKPVNSRHHQGVKRLGTGLVVSATAPDGVVEGVERPHATFAIGVQWHPENRIFTDPRDYALFEAFANALGTRGS